MIGKQLGQGRTAAVYEWSNGKVIKLFHSNISAKAVREEFQKQKLVENFIHCLPKAYEIQLVDSQMGIIYDRVNGSSALNQMMKKPEQAREIAKLMGKEHAQLHNVSLNELPDVRVYLKELILATDKITQPQKNVLITYLEQRPSGNSLCHMDYHPDNIYFEGSSMMVLDWMTASKGSRYADIARTIMILKYAVLPEGFEDATMFHQIREEILAGYLEGYALIHELDEEEIEQWLTIMLAARLTEQITIKEASLIYELLDFKLQEKI